MFKCFLVTYRYNHKTYMKENTSSPKKIFLCQYSKFGGKVLTANNLTIIMTFLFKERWIATSKFKQPRCVWILRWLLFSAHTYSEGKLSFFYIPQNQSNTTMYLWVIPILLKISRENEKKKLYDISPRKT